MGFMLSRDPGSLYLAALPFSMRSIILVAYMSLPDPLITFTSRKKEGGKEKRACSPTEDTIWKSYRSFCS